MHRGGLAYRQGMQLFHFAAWEFLREIIRECVISLARADRAMKEGKALERLRERMASLPGIEEMRPKGLNLEQTVGAIEVTLVGSRALASQEQALIHRTLDEVNRRYGTRIRMSIAPATHQ